MGRRGPKPKPTALRVLEGNPGRLPLNPDEVTCDLPPVMPAAVGMDEIASEEWRRLLAAMPPHVYTALDTGTLATYALAWSMLVKAQKDIDEQGITLVVKEFDEATGEFVVLVTKVNPAVRIWKAASETILKCADRLGLSPSVRARLQVPTRGEQPKSKFAGLLKTV